MPIRFFCQSFSVTREFQYWSNHRLGGNARQEVGGFLFFFGSLSQCSILLAKDQPFVFPIDAGAHLSIIPTFDAVCVARLRCLRSGDSGGWSDRSSLKPTWITLILDKPDSAFRVSVSDA